MTAEQIRNKRDANEEALCSFRDPEHMRAVAQMHMFWLGEVAAQLAEVNQNLVALRKPDIFDSNTKFRTYVTEDSGFAPSETPFEEYLRKKDGERKG